MTRCLLDNDASPRISNYMDIHGGQLSGKQTMPLGISNISFPLFYQLLVFLKCGVFRKTYIVKSFYFYTLASLNQFLIQEWSAREPLYAPATIHNKDS